jgi:hypothetical protein
VKGKRDNTEKQNLYSQLSEKIFLAFSRNLKLIWCRERYVMCCMRKVRIGMAWWRLTIWNMRGSRGEVEKGNVHYVRDKKMPYTAPKLQI